MGARLLSGTCRPAPRGGRRPQHPVRGGRADPAAAAALPGTASAARLGPAAAVGPGDVYPPPACIEDPGLTPEDSPVPPPSFEPLALVGIACLFPRAGSLAD